MAQQCIPFGVLRMWGRGEWLTLQPSITDELCGVAQVLWVSRCPLLCSTSTRCVCLLWRPHHLFQRVLSHSGGQEVGRDCGAWTCEGRVRFLAITAGFASPLAASCLGIAKLDGKRRGGRWDFGSRGPCPSCRSGAAT